MQVEGNKMPKEIEIKGCGVHTMMHYLKALGAFRMFSKFKTSSNKYPDIRTRWENSRFYLQADYISEDSLVDFFYKDYSPTPMITPWNKSGGFFETNKKKSGEQGVGRANDNLNWIENSKIERLREYSDVIKETKRVLASIKYCDESITNCNGEIKNNIKDLKDNEFSRIKQDILRECRNRLSDKVVEYLDATYALTSNKPIFNPILGSGGNDGRSEFIITFMGNLQSVFSNSEKETRKQIRGSLFGTDVDMKKGLVGQFNPGVQFSPNMTNTDISGTSLVNPWDYILMMEGIMLFTGGVTRRLSAESISKASFPFVTEHTMAGDPTASYAETQKKEIPRGEIWAPVWNREVNFAEIQHVFREGRAQIGGKHAKNGSEFARAVISLGTERGISEFHRFVIRARNGKAYIMSHAGRFLVRNNVKNAEVLYDLDLWIKNIERIRNAPKTIENNLKAIQDAIFNFTSTNPTNSPQYLQKILIEVGKMDLKLSVSEKKNSYPITLSKKWIKYCYDGSVEFRLATALASIISNDIGPIRTNLEGVMFEYGRPKWADNSNSVIGKKSSAYKYISSILRRRCIDAMKNNTEYLPLAGIVPAHIQDILDFLHNRVDMLKLIDLFIPLSFIDYKDVEDAPWDNHRDVMIEFRYMPYAYAILKMNFWPYKHKDVYIPFTPTILSLLRGGRGDEAFNIAQDRLAHSGMVPLLKTKRPISIRLPNDLIERIEPALLFPISVKTMGDITKEVLRQK